VTRATVAVGYPCRPVGTAGGGRAASGVSELGQGALGRRARKVENRERDFKQLRVRRCPVPVSETLRFHFGTSKSRGGWRYLPYALTEQGVAMLSSVLRNPRAVHVNRGPASFQGAVWN